jgi:hypothetical protein
VLTLVLDKRSANVQAMFLFLVSIGLTGVSWYKAAYVR